MPIMEQESDRNSYVPFFSRLFWQMNGEGVPTTFPSRARAARGRSKQVANRQTQPRQWMPSKAVAFYSNSLPGTTQANTSFLNELPYTERPSDARTAKSKSATLSNELMMAAFWYLREEHGSVWR